MVAAVSGGPDSVALLIILNLLASEFKMSLIVAHMNHRLRLEADEEERFVRNLAAAMGWPYESESADIEKIRRRFGMSTEEAAREARYAFLDRVAQSHGASRIALGHHKQDQAETVLMNIIRGSGVAGMKGMTPQREGRYIRPLLFVDRDDIIEFLQEQGSNYKIDHSNSDPVFMRNRLRHCLMPILRENFNEKIDNVLSRMAEIVRLDDEFMEEMVNKTFNQWEINPNGDTVALSVGNMSELHEALLNRITKRLLDMLSPSGKGITFSHIAAVNHLIKEGPTTGILCLPANLRVRREYDRIYFFRYP
ncbi:MAG: tRNA lysidine(34) synthetase TilS, partial [Syntrophales bacterium]|nr:tRNA lysidine(34) synthetase TilS [Syntrophales bacterium]